MGTVTKLLGAFVLFVILFLGIYSLLPISRWQDSQGVVDVLMKEKGIYRAWVDYELPTDGEMPFHFILLSSDSKYLGFCDKHKKIMVYSILEKKFIGHATGYNSIKIERIAKNKKVANDFWEKLQMNLHY